MNSSAQEAQDALQAIAQAEAAARRHSPNNGTVPLVWAVLVFACMAIYDFIPPWWAVGVTVAVPVAAAFWTVFYQRRLPVRPLKMEKSPVIIFWSFYHPVVLMSGIALGTHFWHTDCHCLPHGEWTLMGVLDAAPLFWVGWDQRRRMLGDQK